MEKIPVEIIGEICNALDYDQVALKAVRLVNRKFADIAAPYLFNTLTVLPHLSSWRKIQSIAHCPRLAHWVRKLEVVPLIVGDAGSFDDWKQRSQDHRVQGRLRLGERAAAVAELMEPLHDKLAVLLRLQERYHTWLSWVTGQIAIQLAAAQFESQGLPLSLPLPALSEVEIAWPSDLWLTGPHPGRRERGGNFRPGDILRPADQRCNAQLSFTLLILHDSELKITSLELHQYRDVLINLIDPMPVLIYLKHLKLHFRHQFLAIFHRPGSFQWRLAMLNHPNAETYQMELAPYLANAENLETLVLTLDHFIDRYNDRHGADEECRWLDLVPILSTASWPKLRSVWLHRVFTRSPHLIRFLMTYGNSLHSIHLDRPVRREIVLKLLASRIGTQFANRDCIISCKDDRIFRSSACVKESDLSDNPDWPGSTQDYGTWWAWW